ncbi:MAG: magnesium-translocating P-type ATPase [Hyphomicrobium sp.]
MRMKAYWAQSQSELFAALSTSVDGLAQSEAERRLGEQGANDFAKRERSNILRLLLRQYESPLVLILIFAAIVSIVVKEWTDAIIILLIVLGSTILGFTQEYRASEAVRKLRERLSLQALVMRDGKTREIDTSLLVPGDVVLLSAGNLVPADGVIIDARDFLVSQAALTGESFPVEKSPVPTAQDTSLPQRRNVVFLGTSVRSGTAKVLVVKTGNNTEIAGVASHISQVSSETDFERGIRRFGYLLTRIMIVIVLAVLTINLLFHRPPIDSLLFAVALAVGLSPELLPAIMSVTLSAGARRMAERGVIVRRLDAIENLGSADVLCTDKTGTLTKGVVELSGALDASGAESARTFHLAFINAKLETGIENPLDAAIIASAERKKSSDEVPAKIDEIPYDFLRKRLTIVVEADGRRHTIITKGAFDNVLACCAQFATEDGNRPLDDAVVEKARAFYEKRGQAGFRVLGLASKEVAPKQHYDTSDETNMVFEGFLLFFDPLKEGIETTVQSLSQLGIATKIITGDNRYVAGHVGEAIGLDGKLLLTGRQINEMRDEALWHSAARTQIFAEVDPQQKERIVQALQRSGHAVAYMGDGINDGPALNVADVGISVDEAVDVARETADIVLLQRDLDVLRQGVIDGRHTFANTIKYIEITTSANFGNMISMALATLFVPFLPLLAKQILLNNFLSDLPSIAISTDNVDEEMTRTPQHWDIGHIQSFMLVFGLISTLFDLVTFSVLLLVFHADEALFQSTWFVVSVMTELAVLLVLRTHRPAWMSAPSSTLLLATIAVFALSLILTYIPFLDEMFGFVRIPWHLMLIGLLVVAAYVATTERAKTWYFGRKKPESLKQAMPVR